MNETDVFAEFGKIMAAKRAKSVAAIYPELAKEAHGWDSDMVSHGSSKNYEWKCAKGHVWKASPVNRSRGLGRCPRCKDGKIVKEKTPAQRKAIQKAREINSLAFVHPALAKEAHGWDPTKVSRGSTRYFEWKCRKGHIWTTQLCHRTRGHECPYCANRKLLVGFNDFASVHPDLAREAYGWDPSTLVYGSNKRMSWRCDKGHVWESQVTQRDRGAGCPYCSNTKILAGFNDLAFFYPEIAKEADGWDPSTVRPTSNKIMKWRCSKGHTWHVSIRARTHGYRCPQCHKRTYNKR